MNETFVCIKVDREERPDIDGVYMTVCQMMTGSGGWPLTILMTPEQKALLRRHLHPEGKPLRADRDDRAHPAESSGSGRPVTTRCCSIGRAGRTAAAAMPPPSRRRASCPAGGLLDRLTTTLAAQLRQQPRRFRRRPQVPHARTSCSSCCATGSARASRRPSRWSRRRLAAMRRGGIYDHVGFGFHRYSTDARVAAAPLREDALRPGAAGHGLPGGLPGDRQADAMQKRPGEIFTYVLRDMTAPGRRLLFRRGCRQRGRGGKILRCGAKRRSGQPWMPTRRPSSWNFAELRRRAISSTRPRVRKRAETFFIWLDRSSRRPPC